MKVIQAKITRIKCSLRKFLWEISPALFARVVKFKGPQLFSIGIIWFDSKFEVKSAPSFVNPVLSKHDVKDAPAGFVADPFIIRDRDQWFMYFEVYSLITRLGEIGVATSSDGIQWNYRQIVLREPFHLAYPYVFSFDNEIYMIPDSPGNGIRLYRARLFPFEWELLELLVDDNCYSDSSIFHHANQWWMFTGWSREPGSAVSLKLFTANTPRGPWKEHCKSPLTQNEDSISRPAGRVVKLGGKHIRFSQDSKPAYGSSVRAFEILELSDNSYQEEEISRLPLLAGSGFGWNADGMHHIDMHKIGPDQWLACVDGWYSTDSDETDKA